MNNLLDNEQRILRYCEEKSELAKTDKTIAWLVGTFRDFLKTIDDLRGELKKEQAAHNSTAEVYRAKIEAYNISINERAKLLSETRFLREQIAKLKR